MNSINQIHKGVITLGDYDLPGYVDDDGISIERVLT